MATTTDAFSDETKIATSNQSEATGGVLQNEIETGSDFYLKSKTTSSDLLTDCTSLTSLSTSNKKGGGTHASIQFSKDNVDWLDASGSDYGEYGSYSFDGVNDDIQCGAITDFDSFPLTLAAWVNIDTIANNGLFTKHTNSDATGAGFYTLLSGSSLYVYIYDGVGTRYSFSSNIEAGSWNHIAIVFDTSVATLYINGEDVGSSASYTGHTADAAQEFTIGRYSYSSIKFFDGAIHDVRGYSEALSSADIQNLYLRDAEPDATNLKLWLKFDEELDGVVHDYSGNNNHGTVSGATISTDYNDFPLVGLPLYSATDLQVASFDGVNDYVSIPDDDTLEINPSDSASISCWVNFDSLASNSFILSKGEVSGNARGWELWWSSNNKLYFYLIDTWSSKTISVPSNAFSSTLQWHHICVTYDGSATAAGVSIFIDGVDETAAADYDTLSISDTTSNAKDLFIGARTNSADYTNGKIANLAFYNDERSAAEILTDFENGYIDESDANLISYWPLNGNFGDFVGENHGTVSGATSIVDPYRPKPFSENILNFDSSNSTAVFDGSASKVVVSDDDTLDFGSDSFSHSCWIKLKRKDIDDGGWWGIVKKYDNYIYNTGTGFAVGISGGGASPVDNFYIYTVLGDGVTKATIYSDFYASSVIDYWVHIAVVTDRSNDLLRLYVNGVQSETVSISSIGSVSNASNLSIGADLRFFYGQIANVAIWDDIRTASEIKNEYKSGGYVDISNANLVSFWPLNGNADDAVGSNDGTPTSITYESNPEYKPLYSVSNSPKVIDLSSFKSIGKLEEFYYRMFMESQDVDRTFAVDSLTLTHAEYPSGTSSTLQDEFDNEDYVGTLVNSEVTSGKLQSEIEYYANFDGDDDYIELGSILNTDDLAVVGQNLTVHAWIRTSGGGDTYQRIFDKSASGNSANGYGIYLQTSGTFYGAIDSTLISQSGVIEYNNKWHHVAFTADGTNHKIYVNGLLVNTSASAVLPPNETANARIGTWNHSTAREFLGDIAKVYIHNTALSDQEINNIWKTGEIPTANIVDGWELNETSGTVATSYTGTKNGTLTNGCSFTNKNPIVKPLSITPSVELGAFLTSPVKINNILYTEDGNPIHTNWHLQLSEDNSTWTNSENDVLCQGIYSFDGVNDYINLGDSKKLKPNNGDWSVSFWVCSNEQLSGNATLLRDRSAGAAGTAAGLIIYFDNDTLTYLIDDGSAGYHSVPIGGVAEYTDGRWHHIVLTFNATSETSTIYVDNFPKSNTSAIGDITNSNELNLGRNIAASEYFSGSLADVCFFNAALTAEEAENISFHSKIPESSLVARYLFNGNANDSTSNNLDGTVNGATNYTDTEYLPPVGDMLNPSRSACYFDGINDEIDVPDSSTLDLNHAMTISAWVKRHGTFSTWEAILSKWSGSKGWQFGVNNQTIYLYTDGGYKIRSASASFIPKVGEWNHVLITSTPSTADGKVYINAVDTSLLNNGTVNTSLNTQSVKIGNNNAHAYEIPAYLNDIAVFSGIKDHAYVSGLYSSGVVNTGDPDLISYWPLSEDYQDKAGTNHGTNDGSVIYDSPFGFKGSTWSQATQDLSNLCLSDTLYYRLVGNSVDSFNSPSLTEITITYTEGAAAGSDPGLASGANIKNLTFASSIGNEVVINCVNKKDLILVGIWSSASISSAVLRKDSSGGDVICYVPQGQTKFKSPIKVDEGTDVYIDGASNITLVYTWVNN